MKKITAIILTKNEEADLPRCLAALAGFADLIVLDSGSGDRTRDIAFEYDARFIEHPFESFGKQRNWVLDNHRFATEWVLFMDADEVATPAFKEAVQRAITSPSKDMAGFYCCWKMILDGVWLKRADNFPKWQLRLVRIGRVKFIDAGHGQKEGEVVGGLEFIREPYLHYAFSKGWSAWIDRHNRYSTLEAGERVAAPVSLKQALVANPSQRNKLLKPFVSRIPGWPLWRFAYTYLLRGGFLDGSAGFRYCAMIAYYEFIIQLKMQSAQGRSGTRGEKSYANIGNRVL
ncbi:MAG: glycosyltransferase family 2 protein [Terrimicrobiaceae bacterium]|nr:glycosyltransferase family 2 protein [Terrimicrobiaceae bacterium]